MSFRAVAFTGLVLALFAALGAANAQQVNDPGADTSVAHPAFAPDSGPVVGINSAHNNFHTIDGRYQPFAALLRHDGLRVVDFKSPFTPASLSPVQMLVVSNALPASLVDHWLYPPSSAFTPAEIAALKEWVAGGGSLLLIADHLPFASSAKELAAAFGFQLEDGVVERDPVNAPVRDIFTKASGALRDDVVTEGRNQGEAVTSIETFTGSAFHAPAAARPIIALPPDYMIHQCGLPCPAGVPEHSAGGYLQGAVMDFGKGRIAMFGEAAMFSAQLAMRKNMAPFRAGFNAPGAEQNKQFILNLVRWLTRVLPD